MCCTSCPHLHGPVTPALVAEEPSGLCGGGGEVGDLGTRALKKKAPEELWFLKFSKARKVRVVHYQESVGGRGGSLSRITI